MVATPSKTKRTGSPSLSSSMKKSKKALSTPRSTKKIEKEVEATEPSVGGRKSSTKKSRKTMESIDVPKIQPYSAQKSKKGSEIHVPPTPEVENVTAAKPIGDIKRKKKKAGVTPKVVKLVRKKLSSLSDLEFAKESKRKIKHAKKQRLSVIKPIIEQLLTRSTFNVSERQALEGTLNVAVREKKVKKTVEIPLEKSPFEQANWFTEQFKSFFAPSLTSLENSEINGNSFL